MIRTVKEIKDNIHALRVQVSVTLKTTVATTRLGALWWILDPLLLMLIYTFVIKVIFDRGGPNYHLFALCGIVTWQTFARSVNLCATSLLRNSTLIKQTRLPMHLYVMLPPVVQTIFFLIGLGIVAIWNNNTFGWHTLSIFSLIVPMIMIPYSIGLFLSIFVVMIPDIGKFVPYILRFGFYMSPILYPPERVYELESIPEFTKFLYSLNPMVHVITAVRDVLIHGRLFNIYNMFFIVLVTIVAMQIGIIIFRAFSRAIPKEL